MNGRRFEEAVVPILLVTLAFLSPVGITTGVSGTEELVSRIVAPVWVFNLSGPLAGVLSFDISWLHLTAFDFLSQLLLAIAASLYYLGVVGRKAVVLAGLVSPLVYTRGYLLSWMHYPIPVMFVIVVLMMIMRPARKEAGEPKTVDADADAH